MCGGKKETERGQERGKTQKYISMGRKTLGDQLYHSVQTELLCHHITVILD